ncbi:D-2-hydroxyacid dehydrogenase [Actinopolymorpha sp. B11F2]|uniref:D-2-hydroxyacid dehydrogenase n=1 Tax=Actinopolymorpha sp. B11F2 TaxID=3160862 RepID=UPI0032E3B016
MSRSAAPVVTVLCDTHRPPGMAVVEDRADVRYVRADELRDALRGADVFFCWDFLSPALRTAWPGADSLRWVHIASAGVDRLLFPELVESPVVVTNSRGTFDRPIAEWVLAVVLAWAKDLPTIWRLQERREWRHRDAERIEGRSVLVVGTGGIGRAIARLLRVAGMVVSGAGRTPRSKDPDFGEVFASGDLREIVGGVDLLVVAAPLTPQTQGLVDADVLARMRPTARLINVGRGPIVDEKALVTALRAGTIAGAALDVFSVEPLPADSPLWSAPGTLVSPHMAGDTVGWLDDLAALFVTNFERWMDGEPLQNVVDKRLGYVPGVDRPPGEGTT